MNKTIEKINNILEIECRFLEYEAFVLSLVFLTELSIHYLYYSVRCLTRYIMMCLLGCSKARVNKTSGSGTEELLISPA
jgi:hypothetical protein